MLGFLLFDTVYIRFNWQEIPSSEKFNLSFNLQSNEPQKYVNVIARRGFNVIGSIDNVITC